MDTSDSPLEAQQDIRGLNYAYQHWRKGLSNSPARRIIALHGWLDNAASFQPLAEQLGSLEIVALDMAGHGYSEHRHPQGSYNIWDDLLDILALADHLDWDCFSLLGHSRGAAICLLLAACMPERIHGMVCLEGVWPYPVANADAAKQLRSYLLDQRRLGDIRLPVYKNRESALRARCQSTGMPQQSADLLLSRGLKHTPQGYQWRSDPRLTMASAVKFSEVQNSAFAEALKVPSLLCVAQDGFAGPLMNSAEQLLKYHMRLQSFSGGHHFHMDTEVVGSLANAIADYCGQRENTDFSDQQV